MPNFDNYIVPLKIEHVIVEYPDHSAQQQQCLGNDSLNLKVMIGENRYRGRAADIVSFYELMSVGRLCVPFIHWNPGTP